MRYFFDTEFNENVDPIEMISIGIVAESGRDWYGINKLYMEPVSSCNDWVKANVIPVLLQPNGVGNAFVATITNEIGLRNAIVDFIGMDTKPEFWAYYGDYDWFLLTRMFKSFDKMPKTWPQVCYDLHQFARHHGLHRNLPQKFQPVHNALADARWTKKAFEFVVESNVHMKGPLWP